MRSLEDMVVVNGRRYRPEDAPEVVETPKETPAPPEPPLKDEEDEEEEPEVKARTPRNKARTARR